MRDYLNCIDDDNCVLSLGSRHSVEPRNPCRQTGEKENSLAAQKLEAIYECNGHLLTPVSSITSWS
jgi:hypothetical protein